jgi:hypothetical protein
MSPTGLGRVKTSFLRSNDSRREPAAGRNRLMHLIKMWLECPVEETDDRGRKTRTTEAGDKRRGIPQGSPISPLLAPVCAGMEDVRARAKPRLAYRDLRQRSRDPVPEGQRQRGLVATARGEDTICKARKASSTSWATRLAAVLSENGQGISWVPAIAEEHPAHGRERPRADRPIEGMARDHNARSRGEPRAAWMGELLSGRHRLRSIPGPRQLHRSAVAPVVAF